MGRPGSVTSRPLTPIHQNMSSQWSNDYFRDAAGDASHPGRGLVGHVPIVAVLLIVQGALESCLGLFFLFPRRHWLEWTREEWPS
jgi:hypothetical protein